MIKSVNFILKNFNIYNLSVDYLTTTNTTYYNEHNKKLKTMTETVDYF